MWSYFKYYSKSTLWLCYRPWITCFGKTVFNCHHAVKANWRKRELKREGGGGRTWGGADLDGVNLEWTLRVGGIEPDRLLYILELKPR